MTDTTTERLTADQMRDRVETLQQLRKELEDIRIQALGPSSELKQLKTAQEAFKHGIELLKGAELIKELVGGKLDSMNSQLDANIQTADTLAQALDNTKSQAGAIQQRLSSKLATPADIKPADLESLFSQVGAIVDLRVKLVEKVNEASTKVKLVDTTAKTIQDTLVETCKEALVSAKGRLEAARSDAIYEMVHDGVGAILSVVALFEPTTMGPMLKGVQAALQEATNLAQEIHVKVEQSKARNSPLKDTVSGLTPFGVYKSNLLRLGAAFRAAFDGAQLVGLAPIVGVYLAAAVKVLGDMVKGGIDGRVEAAEEVESKMNEELAQVGGTNAPRDEVDKIRAKANTYINTDWKELLGKTLKNLNPMENPANFMEKLADSGAELAGAIKKGDPGEIASAVLEPVLSKLGEAFLHATGMLPAEAPKAIFGFELKMVLTGDVSAINAPFTEGEKEELFYDIGEQSAGAKPTLASLLTKVKYTQPATPIEPKHKQTLTVQIGGVVPSFDPPVFVADPKAGTGKQVEYKIKHKLSSDDQLKVYAAYSYSDINFVKQDRSKEKIGSFVHGVELQLEMENLSTPGRFLVDSVTATPDANGGVKVKISMTYMYFRVDKYRCDLTIDIPAAPAYATTSKKTPL